MRVAAALLVVVLLVLWWTQAPDGQGTIAPLEETQPASSAERLLPATAVTIRREETTPTANRSEDAATPAVREVLVQTLDEGGRPITRIAVGWSASAGQAGARDRAVLTKGLSGTALVTVPPTEDGTRSWIHALVLSAKPICVPVPATPTGDEPLRLIIPSFGSVRIEVDASLAGMLRVSLCTVSSESELRSFSFGSPPTLWRDLEESACLFEAVALGQVLEAQLWGEQGGGRHPRKFEGPKVPGQTVVFRVSEEGFPALSGRVLDEDGAPMAESRLRVQLRSSTANRGFQIRTDAEARFRIELEETLGLKSLDLHPLSGQEPSGFSMDKEDFSRRARAALPSEVHGSVDLGDLRLEPAPVLAAGRVTDRSGAPLAEIQIHVQVRLMERQDGDHVYTGLDRAHAASDAEGRFKIYGDDPGAPLRLTVFSQEYLPPLPLPFLAGDQQLSLTMQRAGTLAGSVQFPAGLERVGILVSLHPPPAGVNSELDLTPNREGRGNFRWRPVPPGSYEVRFHLGSGYPPFHTVPGVVVLEGEPQPDPRLLDLRIEDDLELVEIRLRTADGSPVPGMVTIYTLDPDGQGASGKGVPTQAGLVRMLCRPEAPADLALGAEGFQIFFLPAFRGSAEAVLTPAFDLIVRASGTEPLRNEHGQFFLKTSWYEEDGNVALLARAARDLGTYALGGEREIAVPVSRAAELRLAWLIPQADGAWSSVEALTTRIHSGDAGRVIEVSPPQLD